MKLGGAEVEHNLQFLLRLRKFLLPRLPKGGVLHELALTAMTANEVNSYGRTVSKKQATRGHQSKLRAGDGAKKRRTIPVRYPRWRRYHLPVSNPHKRPVDTFDTCKRLKSIPEASMPVKTYRKSIPPASPVLLEQTLHKCWLQNIMGVRATCALLTPWHLGWNTTFRPVNKMDDAA